MSTARHRLIAVCCLPLLLGACGAISTYNNASTRIAQAKQDEASAQDRLDRTQREHAQLSADEAAMRLQRAALSDSVASTRNRVRQLQAKVRSAQNATGAQQQQAKQLSDRLNALQARIDQSETAAPGRTSVAEQQRDLDRMEQEKHQIEQQIRSLSAAL
ncbi:MAG: hypothetical protein WCO00_16060 [Rhodospirillaceae bacterium]